MSGKCDEHKKSWKKLLLCCTIVLVGIVGIVCVICVIGWLVLRPQHPSFTIRDATIYNLTVNSSPDLFTSYFQITIDSRNPNARISCYYQNFRVFATYRDQQISFYSSIPPTYQGHKDSIIWSPFIIGIDVPISPFNAYAMNQDQASGNIPIVIKIMGQVRWKVGNIKSGHFHLHVYCPTFIPYGVQSQGGLVAGTSIKYPLSVNCQVS